MKHSMALAQKTSKTSPVCNKPKHSMATMSSATMSSVGIGHPSVMLEGMTEPQRDALVEDTNVVFGTKYPHLKGIVNDFGKQKVVLGLEYWYRKPLCAKHKKYCKIEIQSLLDGVALDTDEGIMLVQLCQQLMAEYDL